MTCPHLMRTGALLDDELPSAERAAAEAHVNTCEECRRERDFILSSRERLRQAGRTIVASDALHRRIDFALDAAPPGRLRQPIFWQGLAAGFIVAALSGVLAIGLLPRLGRGDVDSLVAEHTTAMANDLLIAVPSSDRHTVRPWFAGRADVSPAVEDFAAQGYALIGGRAVRIAETRFAVLVYRHGAHVLDVYVSPARRGDVAEQEFSRLGYHVRCWRQADLRYCAVTDAAWGELRAFAGLLRTGDEAP